MATDRETEIKTVKTHHSFLLVLAVVGGGAIVFSPWRRNSPKPEQELDKDLRVSSDNPMGEVVVNTTATAIKGDLQNLYRVKRGDSLYSIARKHDVSVKAIKDANRDTDNLLAVGEMLVIPQ